MLIWLFAICGAWALAFAQYRLLASSGGPRATVPFVLRGTALTIILALLFDAPIGFARHATPYAALDVSASWRAIGDNALWQRAVRSADSVGGDTLLLVGDSLRSGKPPAEPADAVTRAAPLVERAIGSGRPVVFITDGRVDDPERLTELPSGSRVVLIEGAPKRDAAITSLDTPSAVVSGDTIALVMVIAAGGAGAGTGQFDITLDGVPLAGAKVDSLAPFAEREIRLRAVIVGAPGVRLLRAVLHTVGDVTPANDTLFASLDVARGASAVFVSTSPDFDSRYALDVLRGTLAVPTRGYFRVAPGQWRVEGAMSPVGEAEVRRALVDAPLAVIHGDTGLFGPPRALTHGALTLMAPPAQKGDDYYATSAPPSPLATGLAGMPWDSLPPVEIGAPGSDHEWIAVNARRGRRFDERPLVVGSSHPRRIVIVSATGLWRWKFRGGRSAEAFTALWGSIFDWMTGDTHDVRLARPASAWFRAGEPVRWRRGSSLDSTATIILRRRGTVSSQVDTLTVRFTGESGMGESAPLPAGIYETHINAAAGETRSAPDDGLLVVNASAEWLPRHATVRSGAIGAAAPSGRAPRARTAWWLFAVAIGLLCAEWLMRRQIGLR